MKCLADAANAMKFLHDNGIIHRDLKSDSLLVVSLNPNSDVLCKITDFGESRKGMDQTRTMTMTVGVGTPYYMAPEMLRCENKYTRAVDVYSYAIMCVEIWNERLPFSETEFDSYMTELRGKSLYDTNVEVNFKDGSIEAKVV